MKKFMTMALVLNKEYIIALVGALAISLALIAPAGAEVVQNTTSDEVVALQIDAKRNHTKTHGALPVAADRSYIVRETHVTVTAYNSVPAQTDDTPCIGAQGTDICKIYEAGENVCAANFVPLGTKIEVEGLGTCVVRDRMNARYYERVDWYTGMDISAARQFGVRNKQIAVYSK